MQIKVVERTQEILVQVSLDIFLAKVLAKGKKYLKQHYILSVCNTSFVISIKIHLKNLLTVLEEYRNSNSKEQGKRLWSKIIFEFLIYFDFPAIFYYIYFQEQEIQRRERELDSTVRRPAEAEKYKLERLAEANKNKVFF